MIYWLLSALLSLKPTEVCINPLHGLTSSRLPPACDIEGAKSFQGKKNEDHGGPQNSGC